MDYTIAAVERALSLLEAVADQPGIGLTELARRLGCTKTLAFRVAATLEARGYLLKGPDKSYTIGYRPMKLVERMGGTDLLLRVCVEPMDRLLAQTAENVALIVREGTECVCIAQRQSPQPIRLFGQLGRYGPLHAGGGPKLLLAFAPPEVRNAVLAAPLPRFTDATVTDAAALRRVLDHIRETGSTVSGSEIDQGVFSIAAPVRDHAGQVVAALSVAGPESRLTPERRQHFATLVRHAADQVSAGLGWTLPGAALSRAAPAPPASA